MTYDKVKKFRGKILKKLFVRGKNDWMDITDVLDLGIIEMVE